MDSQKNNTTINIRNEKQPTQLKFGIDRLLATDTHSSSEETSQMVHHHHHVAKPLPTIAVPCSDCVTSLFRCCRLSPNSNVMPENCELFGHHQSFGSAANSNIYTVQPIRPFATRPGKCFILFNFS